MNTRNVGGNYEDMACRYIEKQGHIIIARNFASKVGEIDVVSVKEGTFHFIEVKYRKDNEYGTGSEAVSKVKLKKIYKVAEYFLVSNKLPSDLPCSIDVISIQGDEIEYIENCYGVM